MSRTKKARELGSPVYALTPQEPNWSSVTIYFRITAASLERISNGKLVSLYLQLS